jgi:glycosyltransferase involved in cell wall biosynthesis
MESRTLGQESVTRSKLEVSIVIPVFNEAENILPLYAALKSALVELRRTWEVIFVDDGSTDTTYALLKQLNDQGEMLRIIRLRRNFGQTAAMAAGFDHASGEIVVAMDGDLQNDPTDIVRLLEKLDEGYDVVSGWRANRQDGFWLRRLPSHIANRLISRTTGTWLHDYGCTLKAYRREVINELRLYGEMHRFIPALLEGNGARVAELSVTHHARRNGHSKYGIYRTVRVMLDLLLVKFSLSFLTKPLQIFGLVGLITLLPGLAICGSLLFGRIFLDQTLADRPLFLLGILLTVIGVQFISMGILAEIQIRTYHEAANKPIYLIREILNPNGTQALAGEFSQPNGSSRLWENKPKTVRVQTG